MEERRAYLDSSALVKRCVQEKGTEILDSTFKEAEAGTRVICFSMWNVGELAALFDRVQRREGLNGKDVFGRFL